MATRTATPAEGAAAVIRIVSQTIVDTVLLPMAIQAAVEGMVEEVASAVQGEIRCPSSEPT